MGIFQSDLIITSALRVGIADIRKNRYLADQMLEELTKDPYLKDVYGEQEIRRFREFLDNEIYVFVEHRPPDTVKYPCVVVSIGSGQEDSRQMLADGHSVAEGTLGSLGGAVAASPRTMLGPVTPIAYDKLTGQVTFDSKVNLSESTVFEDMFVYDSKNNKFYKIELVLDNQTLLIEPGSNPDLTDMSIYPTKQVVNHIQREIKVWENHSLKLYSTDPTELLYLFSTMIYLLQRYKKRLFDDRGFSLSTLGYGDLYRANAGDDPNNLYGRDMTIRGYITHSVTEQTTIPLDGINHMLKIESDRAPLAIKAEVDAQGWSTIDKETPENPE